MPNGQVSASYQNAGGEIAVIAPHSLTVDKVFPLDACIPHGIMMGPNDHLVVGCSADATVTLGARAKTLIIDATNGAVIKEITEIGSSDQVWYNPGDQRYYVAGNGFTASGFESGLRTPSLGIIDARTNKVHRERSRRL
jgi:hypothetical protein